MKRSFLGVGIFGILLILAGTTFALQGNGMIGGSAMTGNPFWINAGSVIAVVGLIVAGLGFALGSRKPSKAPTEKINPASDSAPTNSPNSPK